MAFWGTLISRKKRYVHCAHGHNRRLRITQASLGLKSRDNIFNEEKVYILCSHGKVNPFPLCVLIPEKIESQSLALELDMKDDVEISVTGRHEVSLCGYFLDDHSALNNDHSDTEGEDIQGSENNDNSDDDDYDYDDDFIVDDRDIKDDSYCPHKKSKSSGSLKWKRTRKHSCDDEEVKSNKQENTINFPVKPAPKPKAEWKQLTAKFDL